MKPASSLHTVRRKACLVVCSTTLLLQWGCYSYLPVQSAPPAEQQRLAVTLSDRGRFLMAERLGSSIDYVEGTLLSRADSGVVLAVSGTRDLRGGSAVWSGEQVAIPAEAILGYRPRKLSKTRSFLLAGAVVAGLAILTFGTSLDLFGDEKTSDGEVDPPGGENPTSSKAPLVGGIVPPPDFQQLELR